MDNLVGVVRLLKKEQDRLTKQLRGIGAALAAFSEAYEKGTRTRTLSASARSKIAAAQRARWARTRQGAELKKTAKKRSLPLSARRKIAAAQRARWARVRAAKKTS